MEGSLCGLCQKKDAQSRNCAISKEGSWHGLCQKKTYNRAVAQLANAIVSAQLRSCGHTHTTQNKRLRTQTRVNQNFMEPCHEGLYTH